ncbi:MAG: 3'(2'),5'-bisphosphate nucleotidase CysQ [Rhodospirillales bacterium]|nr:3'(2'),5'-bisphosphate nucleotidase CysQ [Rhodospirillales bacterium]
MTVELSLNDVDHVVDVALRAGAAIMAVYRSDFVIRTKADSSPVTVADTKAEEVIIAGIEELTNSFTIVGEESVAATGLPADAGRTFWLVDPLDGTKEFVNRRDEFTVNIALIDSGRPVLGVVHAPAIDATYWGSHYGAVMAKGSADARPISVRAEPPDGMTAVVSRSHRTPAVDAFLAARPIKEAVSTGSSLKFCLLACGRADIYPRFGRTMEWDTAAGHAVLRFAGGNVVGVDGVELGYGKPGFENPDFIAIGSSEIRVPG